MADRLTLSHAFEDAGIERAKAERVASAVYDVIHDEVATKADVQSVNADIQSLRFELKADNQALRSELHIAIRDVKIWTGGSMVVAVGIILAAIRLIGH